MNTLANFVALQKVKKAGGRHERPAACHGPDSLSLAK